MRKLPAPAPATTPSHFLRPALPWWAEHFQSCWQSLDQHVAAEAVGFEGIRFLHVFFYLLGKRYGLLARHCVGLRAGPRTGAQVVALLRTRTQRLPRPVLVPA